jgi:hypothetical protein
MTEAEFWEYIETARADAGSDSDRQMALLVERIAALPEAEIMEFERAFSARFNESYSWDLWGAAVLINGGASDDGFDYFRGWLISKGGAVYENALKDPDSLADVLTADDVSEGGVETSGMLYVGMRAYEKRTGRELYDDMADTSAPVSPLPPEPGGEPWEDDAELDTRFPRLAALVEEGEKLYESRHAAQGEKEEEDEDGEED